MVGQSDGAHRASHDADVSIAPLKFRMVGFPPNSEFREFRDIIHILPLDGMLWVAWEKRHLVKYTPPVRVLGHIHEQEGDPTRCRKNISQISWVYKGFG